MEMQPTKTCESCGRVFAKTRTMTRWASRRFCDRQCSGAARRMHPIEQACAHCGRLFRPRSGSGRVNLYCSQSCGARARPITSPDTTGRARARLLFPDEQPCEVCGAPFDGRRGSARHHVDANRLNNSPENIRWLCKRHHAEVHGGLDGKVGGGARPRVNASQRQAATDRGVEARRLRDEGLTVDEVAARMGVHRVSVLRWARRYAV